jgi:hypothetical protein
VTALSSAEAELYAMVAASAEALAIAAYARDLGLDLGIEMYCDSAAALGITNRAGIGKVRHLRTQGLWVQEVRISGRIAYRKVLGEKNPADLLTKHLGAEVIAKHVDTLNMIWVEGRAESAPTLDSVESYLQTWVEDGADDHDYNYDYDNDIDEVTEETKGGRKKVRFADLVSVRPIPSVGKGKPTPPRGARAGGAVWQPDASADNVNIGRGKCNCGGQLRKGDGNRWGDAEDDLECATCAGRWGIDSVEIARGPDSHEPGFDRRGELIGESKRATWEPVPLCGGCLGGTVGPRVRPICFRQCEVRGVQSPTDSFGVANAMSFDCSLPVPCTDLVDSPRCWIRRRRSVRVWPTGDRQAIQRVCMRGQAACALSTGASEASCAACGRVGSSS